MTTEGPAGHSEEFKLYFKCNRKPLKGFNQQLK